MLTFQVFHSGVWHDAAQFEVQQNMRNKGIKAESAFVYLDSYVAQNIGKPEARALSCRYPTNFEYHQVATWPAFALDLMPQGAARAYFVSELDLSDGPGADWELLSKAAGNPPGNIRVKEAAADFVDTGHIGFSRAEVVTRRDTFIEYVKRCGASVAGSTGAGGDAPKFLLTQDRKFGNWHADGALADSRAAQHWLLKFPRGRKDVDYKVLRNEAAYLHVAKDFGLRVQAGFQFENDTLFLPRFDRKAEKGAKNSAVVRCGLETLASITGIAEWGARPRHDDLLKSFLSYCTNATEEMIEYLRRDILNIALGNTDNHARNTALLKQHDGNVALSPLYDFAPMYLDPEGIARVCRWRDEEDLPNWETIIELGAELGVKERTIRKAFLEMGALMPTLPKLLKKHKVDQDIIEHLAPRIAELETSLKTIKK